MAICANLLAYNYDAGPAELLGLENGDDVCLLVSAMPGLKTVLSDTVEKDSAGEVDISAPTDITGQYIRDYERVKLRVKHGMVIAEIPAVIAMQPSLVKAYGQLIEQYHPDLLSKPVSLA